MWMSMPVLETREARGAPLQQDMRCKRFIAVLPGT